MKSVTLVVKATRLCNLRCAYCTDWRAGKGHTMSFEVLARMIQGALSDPEHGRVEFIWHGGEPTMLPPAFYDKVLRVQARFQRPGQAVSNAIQTNGTRLTQEWVRFLRAHAFGVGVSIDGPRELHDRHRRYASGLPSFNDVARGLRLLREQRVRFSVLMVIDEATLALGPDPVFDFFLEQGISSFGLLAAKPANWPAAVPGTSAEHYVDPARLNTFLARLYDRWLEHGDPRIRIRELTAIEQRLAAQGSSMCTLAGNCFGSYYMVDTGGNVAHCDLFQGDSGYSLGNVLEHDFAHFRDSAQLARLRAANEARLERMRSCADFAVCNGWCPHEHYVSLRHNAHHRDDCCGLSELITHIRSRQSQAVEPPLSVGE